MFFWKKKKEKELLINSKFHLGDFVGFRYKGELSYGIIRCIREFENRIYYDISVGGEATMLAQDIEEEKIIWKKRSSLKSSPGQKAKL